MEIYSLLPTELQNKIKYYVLEHPIARIIKDDISRLRCDEHYTFRDNGGKVFCKVDGRDFYANEYFRKFNKKKDRNRGVMSSDGCIEYHDIDSDSSDEYFDDVFNRLFLRR